MKNFFIDKWYKAFIGLGSTLLIIAITCPVKLLTNTDIGLVGLSFFFIGLGEWKSQKFISQRHPGGILQIPVRHHDFLSILFWIIGLILATTFIIRQI